MAIDLGRFPIGILPAREASVIRAALLGYRAWIKVLGDEMNVVGCSGGTLVCAHVPTGPLKDVVDDMIFSGDVPPDPTFRLVQVSSGRAITWEHEVGGWEGSYASSFDGLVDTALCSLGYTERPFKKADLRNTGKAFDLRVEGRALKALLKIAGNVAISAGYWPQHSDGSIPRHLRFEITDNTRSAAPGPAFHVTAFVSLMVEDVKRLGGSP